MIRLDIAYAERLNLWRDLMILIKTPITLCQQYFELHSARRAKPVRAGNTKPQMQGYNRPASLARRASRLPNSLVTSD